MTITAPTHSTIPRLHPNPFLKTFQNPIFHYQKPIFCIFLNVTTPPSLSLFSRFSHRSEPNSVPFEPPTSDPGLLFREKIVYLQKLNVNPQKALELNPKLRSTPLSSLLSVWDCLSSMGIERSAMGRILDMYPQLLTSDPNSELRPIFDFLINDVGIPYRSIGKAINRCPRLLVCDVDEQLRPTLLFLMGSGFVGSNSINWHTALLLVSSVEGTLFPKIQFLQSLGFSHWEVRNMIVRSPGLLTYNVKNNLMPKSEYFLKEMNGDKTELKIFPQYFSYSLEGKIKPRHRKLVEQGFWLPLSDMLKVSDGEFDGRLVEMRLHPLKDRVFAS